MSLTAVFDAGKTRLKLSLVTQDGTIMFVDSVPSRVEASTPGALDVERAEAFLCHALSSAGARFPINRFVAVGHGAAAVWVNERGLAAPVMDYETEVPAVIRARYEIERPAFIETYSPSLPLGLNLGRQLAWAEAMKPELNAPLFTLLPWPQYWAWRMCGSAASEISSLGSHTDLWAPRAETWSNLARSRGWDERFADLAPASAVLGTAQGVLAHDAGLRSDCQIVCGAHDSNAALYAIQSAGMLKDDICLISTGTWTVTMAPDAALGRLDPTRDCLGNISVSGSPVPTCRFMGGVEYARLASDTNVLPDAEACTELVRLGSMALPSFAEAGGPFAAIAGQLIGPPPQNAKASAAVAALYFALMVAYEIELLGTRRTLVLEGVVTRNPIIPALIAELTGAAVFTCGGEAVAIGAARLAMPFDTTAALALRPVEALHIRGLDAYAKKWRACVAARDKAAAAIGTRRPEQR